MKKYKISDILDSKQIGGNSQIIKFVNECKKNISNLKSDTKNLTNILKLNSIKNKILCYSINFLGKQYITIPRETLIEIINLTGGKSTKKTIIEIDKVTELLTFINGANYNQYNILEVDKTYDYGKGNTKLKQELVCLAISFFFRYPSKNIFTFHEYIKNNSNFDTKSFKPNLPASNFNKFASTNNYKYIIDSCGVARTLIHNATKLNLNNLKNYIIAEESSEFGNILKEIPYKKIKDNPQKIPGYFTSSDKLMIADIFLIDTRNNEYNKTISVIKKKNLSHETYRTFMNKCFREGAIIPISLKQLAPQNVDENLITNRIKIIGSYNENKEKKSIEDDYMMKVIELFSTTSKKIFFEKMKKVIDIKYTSVDFMKSNNPPQAEFQFDTSFKVGEKNKRTFKFWISQQQIYIIPEGTTSYSGLGGISSDYLFENVIKKLPGNYKYMRQIESYRDSVFGDEKKDAFENSDRNLADVPKLEKYLKTKTDYQRSQLLSKYAQELKKKMKNGVPNLQVSQFRSLEKDSKKVASKIFQFEMLFFVLSNQSIIVDWVKNSFIMSLYGIASGRGKIIFDGKNIKLGDFGRNAVKKYSLLNPLYLKIGM
jgi:hypothetical protein